MLKRETPELRVFDEDIPCLREESPEFGSYASFYYAVYGLLVDITFYGEKVVLCELRVYPKLSVNDSMLLGPVVMAVSEVGPAVEEKLNELYGGH